MSGTVARSTSGLVGAAFSSGAVSPGEATHTAATRARQTGLFFAQQLHGQTVAQPSRMPAAGASASRGVLLCRAHHIEGERVLGVFDELCLERRGLRGRFRRRVDGRVSVGSGQNDESADGVRPPALTADTDPRTVANRTGGSMTTTVIVSFQAKAGKRDALLALLKDEVQRQAIAADCHSIAVYRVAGSEDRAVEMEAWNSQADHERFVKAAAEAGAFAPFDELLAAPFEMSYCDLVKKSEA